MQRFRGQLISLWENSNQVQKLDDQTQEALLQQLKTQSIELNPQTKQITLAPAIKIAPDAYAKGYVIDRALLRRSRLFRICRVF